MRKRRFRDFLIPLLLAATAAGLASGCATNPVTGTPDFVLMSEASEISLGNSFDKRVKDRYKVYPDEALQAYVQDIGRKLAAQSHRPQLEYHFTVLDSPEVNAFALPGGHIYITRGILAYFNSEAELAAVLGHELGHVTARHGVRQHSAATATGMVGAILGAATGVRVTQDLFNALGGAMLSGYGREHELESDRLGAEYLARTGYDPQAVIRVLGILKNQEEFEKERAAAEKRQPRIYHGVYATHPSADARLQEVVGAADRHKTLAEPKQGRAEFLKMIEKLPFGDHDRTDRVLRNNRYYHLGIGVTLLFPEDWQVAAGDYRITASSPDSQSVLQVDIDDVVEGMSPETFLKTRMGVTSLEQGGALPGMKHPAHTGIVPASPAWGERKTRVSAVYFNDKRFLFSGAAMAPERFPAADAAFRKTALSLRAMNSREAAAADKAAAGPRVRVVTARAGDTYAALAGKSPLEKYAETTLRLINGQYPDGEPRAGELIKIIE